VNTVWAQESALPSSSNAVTGREVIQSLIHSVNGLKTCQFEMQAKERIDNTYVYTHSVASINFAPRKIFLRAFNESGGLKNEILYVNGQNDNEALIASQGFPYINLNLNPLGNTMRNKKHLTILEAGGKFMASMLSFGLPKMTQNSENVAVKCVSKAHEEYGPCYVVTIQNNDYTFQMVDTKSESSLRNFCNAHGVPEYKVMEINDAVSSFDQDISQNKLLIPTYYAKEIKIVVRQRDYIPMGVELYDEKGLYASYTYEYFKVNPALGAQVFDKDNPAYTF
jgi:hypothetical protein